MVDLAALLTGLLGVLVGAIVQFFLGGFQDRMVRRREWRARYLRDAYLSLIDASTVPEWQDGQSYDKKRKMAEVVNTIGLFGDEETIRKTNEIISALKRSESTEEWVSYEPLFKALNNQFREELGMKRIAQPPIMFVRRVDDHETITNRGGVPDAPPE
jgi:hypothetical protein